MAFATSEISARVGRGFTIMLSSIWVAVTMGLPKEKERSMMVKDGGDVGGIHGAEDVPKRMVLLLVEQHGQGLLQGKIVFCHVLFLLKLMNRKVKTQRRHIKRRKKNGKPTWRTKAAWARADFGLRMCRYYFLRPLLLPPLQIEYCRCL